VARVRRGGDGTWGQQCSKHARLSRCVRRTWQPLTVKFHAALLVLAAEMKPETVHAPEPEKSDCAANISTAPSSSVSPMLWRAESIWNTSCSSGEVTIPQVKLRAPRTRIIQLTKLFVGSVTV
jgi:hypothetical protein